MKGKVLVVDDEPLCRRDMVRALEGAGFTVASAGDALEALKVLEETPHDAIVIDYLLPNTNGLEFVRLLRLVDKRIGVVMITGCSARDVERKCEGLGVWSVLEKPFEMADLAAKVSDAVELAHLPPEREAALAEQFGEEATRMRTLRQDLMNETQRWPLGS